MPMRFHNRPEGGNAGAAGVGGVLREALAWGGFAVFTVLPTAAATDA
jgi:hypothetical protein